MLSRLLVFVSAIFLGVSAHAQSFINAKHTTAELVSEVLAVTPGQELWLALRLESQPKWHTYWVNPGEAGLPSTIVWAEKPEGMEIGEIQWPAPKLFIQGDLVNYVYEGEAFLLMRARVPAVAAVGQVLELKARADWLECDDSGCWPGGADVALSLPVVAAGSAEAAAPSPWAKGIASALGALPRTFDDSWQMSAERIGADGYRLQLTPLAQGNTGVQPIYFFPLSSDIKAGTAASQQLTRGEDGSITLHLQAASDVGRKLERIEGVFTAQGSWGKDGSPAALLSGADVTAGGGLLAGGSVTGGEVKGLSLQLLGLAFVGGLILNLMPCVFPVLGIKVLGFVQQAGSERRKVVLHGLVFTLGVLLSFWVLSGVLIALRMGGAELGWGFQLQSPAFVAGLSVLLLVFGLSLSGVFDLGYGAVGVGSNLAAQSGLKGSFFSGVLATVVATPCAAPFLAPALGAALALPAFDSLLVFTAIALGLSLPYLLLSIFPKLVSFLPKPGAWMETFKQAMAFLLYATVAYLLWALAGLVSEEWFLNILIGLVALAAACWAYGRWLNPSSKTKLRGWVLTLLFAALGGWLVFTPVRTLEWEDWSPQRVAELQKQGRPIYVDFTARWCATCQVNKRVIFGSEAVLERFKKDRVALLKADWTDRNDTISTELAKYGRAAVPFNLLYGPAVDEPLILPELLTPSIVLEALDKVVK